MTDTPPTPPDLPAWGLYRDGGIGYLRDDLHAWLTEIHRDPVEVPDGPYESTYASSCPACDPSGVGRAMQWGTGESEIPQCASCMERDACDYLHRLIAKHLEYRYRDADYPTMSDGTPWRPADPYTIMCVFDEAGIRFRNNATTLSLEARLDRHNPYPLHGIAGNSMALYEMFYPRYGRRGGECASPSEWVPFTEQMARATITMLSARLKMPSGKNFRAWQPTQDSLKSAMATIIMDTWWHDPAAEWWRNLPTGVEMEPHEELAYLFDGDGGLRADQRKALADGLRVMLASTYWRQTDPGSSCDSMLILAGAPGSGKTKFIEWLFEPLGEAVIKSWTALDKQERDTIYEMHQSPCVLFDEMEGLDKWRAPMVNRQITGRQDQITRKWQTSPDVMPRRFVMAGTKNLSARTLPWDEAFRRRLLFVRTGTPWHVVHPGEGLMEYLDELGDDWRRQIWGAVRDRCLAGAPGWAQTKSGIRAAPDTQSHSERLYTALMNRRAQDDARDYLNEVAIAAGEYEEAS